MSVSPPQKKSTEHTEDTEKDFRRMIKTIPQPSDFRPQNSDFIFALHLQYYSFWKAKTGAFRPNESMFIKGQTKENEDKYHFFSQHLHIFYFIFINLHGKL